MGHDRSDAFPHGVDDRLLKEASDLSGISHILLFSCLQIMDDADHAATHAIRRYCGCRDSVAAECVNDVLLVLHGILVDLLHVSSSRRPELVHLSSFKAKFVIAHPAAENNSESEERTERPDILRKRIDVFIFKDLSAEFQDSSLM